MEMTTITVDKKNSPIRRPGRCYQCQRTLGGDRIVVAYYNKDEYGRSKKVQQRRYCNNICLTELARVKRKSWWKRFLHL